MIEKFLTFIHKNPILSKYGLAIIVLFAMIVSIRTYMNYLAIETSIESVNEETVQITQRKLYEQNFLMPYEQSEYSEYFLWHENNILFPGEFVIRFENERPPNLEETEPENSIKTPQDSRHYFFENIKNIYR
jgi:hypothetical protein